MPSEVAAADTAVENLSEELSQMQPPTPIKASAKTPNNYGSPTPLHRRSKTRKSHQHSSAGNITAPFPMNQEAIDNIDFGAVDNVMDEKLQTHAAAAAGGDDKMIA